MIRFGDRCRQAGVRGAAVVVLGLALGMMPPAARGACTGDCDGDGEVTVAELLTMVNIALGSASISTCMAGDESSDGEITVEEIVSGVNNLLNGCPGGPTPTPTVTPTVGPLGTRHFVINPTKSSFQAVLSGGFPINVGSFVGQTNGETGPAFFDLEVGQPDTATGVATVNIVNASEYILASNRQFGITVCLHPVVPAMNAGAVACRGGFPFSFQTTIDHDIGQVGVDGFTAAQCESTCNGGLNCGRVESPNQICGAGMIGEPCRANGDCDTTANAGDGICGIGAAMCTAPDGHTGACRSDADCDSGTMPDDGVCGFPLPHPGVCNGPIRAEVLGGDTGPGEVIIAPNSQFGLNGLPLDLLIETAPPCGDEGPGERVIFALTTGVSRSTILDYDDKAEQKLTFNATGQNFSCASWPDANGPGRLALSAPALHTGPNNTDLVTAFIFDGSPEPTPTPPASQ